MSRSDASNLEQGALAGLKTHTHTQNCKLPVTDILVLEGPHQPPREEHAGDGEQERTAAARPDHLTWMLSVIHTGADYSLTGAKTQS